MRSGYRSDEGAPPRVLGGRRPWRLGGSIFSQGSVHQASSAGVLAARGIGPRAGECREQREQLGGGQGFEPARWASRPQAAQACSACSRVTPASRRAPGRTLRRAENTARHQRPKPAGQRRARRPGEDGAVDARARVEALRRQSAQQARDARGLQHRRARPPGVGRRGARTSRSAASHCTVTACHGLGRARQRPRR